MHEAALALELEKIAMENNPDRAAIHCIRLQRGKLSCINEESLRFAFRVIARGTPAENAMLEFQEIEGSDCLVTALELEDGSG